MISIMISSENPEQLKPTIVVDLQGLSYCHSIKLKDVICGVGGRIVANQWDRKVKQFTDAGCSLVFFSRFFKFDVDNFKLTKKVDEYNKDFVTYTKIYDEIDSEKSIRDICKREYEYINFTRTIHRLLVNSLKEYGVVYSVDHRRFEPTLADYATRHNAMAVVSMNTQFLIIEGSWKFWWPKNVEGEEVTLQITEYDRIVEPLTRQQMPP